MTIIKGTDNTIDITFKEDGEVLDITGYNILFTVKKQNDVDKSDDYAIIKKDIVSHTDAINGITTLVLGSDDTDVNAGQYYYDLRLIKDGVISQTERGVVKIKEGITERSA